MGIFHVPFKRFLIPVRRCIKISRKTLLEREKERERERKRERERGSVPIFREFTNFEMGKGAGGSRGRRGVAALTAFHRFEQPPTGVGTKGLRENSSSRRQRGSYLEFLKSHLPSCPLQRSTILLTLGSFSSPRNPFTGGFLARDIVISGVSFIGVFRYFFFFSFLSFLY